jgi:SNF2 family DNA or RNA helicase
MLRLSKFNDQTIQVEFNYWPDYVKRIRTIPGAQYINKYWLVPVASLPIMEQTFRGELVYVTPRYQITGDPPPLFPDWYYELPQRISKDIKTPLFDYQVVGANFVYERIRENGYAFLCDYVGLGKSPQAVGGVSLLREDGIISPHNPVLVVCLGAIKTQWQRDVIGKFSESSSIVIKGTKKQRQKQYLTAGNYDYVILNYELLLQDLDEISSIPFEMKILDEPHEKVLDCKGKIHMALKQLDIPKTVFLTATPTVSDPGDIYSLWDLCDPDYLGKVTQFRNRYIVEYFDREKKFMRFIGCKNLDELEDRIGRFILARTPDQVGVKMPEILIENHFLEISPGQKQIIDRLNDERKDLETKIRNAKGARLRKLQNARRSLVAVESIASGIPYLLSESDSEIVKKYADLSNIPAPKLDKLMEIVDEVLMWNDKAIIFSMSKKAVYEIVRVIGPQALAFTGDHSEDEKDDIVTAFMNDPDIHFLVCTEAGQNGLNLQVAGYIANFDMPWTAKDLEQRIGRAQRVGSRHENIIMVNLITKGSVDERAIRAIKNRNAIAVALLSSLEGEKLGLLA